MHLLEWMERRPSLGVSPNGGMSGAGWHAKLCHPLAWVQGGVNEKTTEGPKPAWVCAGDIGAAVLQLTVFSEP